jgi:hypothetical protein
MLDDIFDDEQLPNTRVYEMAQTVVRDFMQKEYKNIDFVAQKLGTTRGYLYASLDPKQTHKPLSIDRIMDITKLTCDNRIIEVIANEFDLIAIGKQKSEATTKDLNILADIANIENNDVFKEVKKDLEDGIIDRDEQKRILKEIDEAQIANAKLKDIVEKWKHHEL